MEADAEGVAPIADPVGLLPTAMLQTCQRQRSRGIALDRAAAIDSQQSEEPVLGGSSLLSAFCYSPLECFVALEPGGGEAPVVVIAN
jgi:hypothetical protein